MYGEGKYCPPTENGKLKTVLKFKPEENGCKNIDDLGEIIATSRNYDETHRGVGRAGIRSHGRCARSTSASPSSPMKARASSASRTSACCGARVTTCRPRISSKEAARLYEQVKPLYQSLHCYARGRLREEVRRRQGAGRQADSGALVRQHVGAAVESRVRRPAQALPGRQHRIRGPHAARRRSGTRCA